MQQQRRDADRNLKQIIITLGLVGAALLYGDGVITPAISVLGAMEGLEVVTPKLHVTIVPLTILILLSLFLVQKKGTHESRPRVRPGDDGLVRHDRRSRPLRAEHGTGDSARCESVVCV